MVFPLEGFLAADIDGFCAIRAARVVHLFLHAALIGQGGSHGTRRGVAGWIRMIGSRFERGNFAVEAFAPAPPD